MADAITNVKEVITVDNKNVAPPAEQKKKDYVQDTATTQKDKVTLSQNGGNAQEAKQEPVTYTINDVLNGKKARNEQEKSITGVPAEPTDRS